MSEQHRRRTIHDDLKALDALCSDEDLKRFTTENPHYFGPDGNLLDYPFEAPSKRDAQRDSAAGSDRESAVRLAMEAEEKLPQVLPESTT